MTRFVVTRPVSARSGPVPVPAGLPDVCRRYRRALRRAGIACPAEVLWLPETARWVRREGMAVDVRSSAELSLALSAGISPARIIMHCDGAQAGPIRCAVNAGVGLMVVDSSWQVDVLAHYARDRQRVLVDVTAPGADDPADAVLETDRLELVGLHRGVDDAEWYGEVVFDVVGRMADLRSERGALLTRVSLAGAVSDDPRRLAVELEDALDDACARFRCPRPGVTLALLWPIIRPE